MKADLTFNPHIGTTHNVFQSSMRNAKTMEETEGPSLLSDGPSFNRHTYMSLSLS